MKCERLQSDGHAPPLDGSEAAAVARNKYDYGHLLDRSKRPGRRSACHLRSSTLSRCSGTCLIRSETITNDATVVCLYSHCSVARCLRDIDGIAQLNIKDIAHLTIKGSYQPNGNDGSQLTEFDRGADLSSGARGRHRLRDQR